jgi:hypothetical protein
MTKWPLVHDSAQMSPPCSRTVCRASASPRPKPCILHIDEHTIISYFRSDADESAACNRFKCVCNQIKEHSCHTSAL